MRNVFFFLASLSFAFLPLKANASFSVSDCLNICAVDFDGEIGFCEQNYGGVTWYNPITTTQYTLCIAQAQIDQALCQSNCYKQYIAETQAQYQQQTGQAPPPVPQPSPSPSVTATPSPVPTPTPSSLP